MQILAFETSAKAASVALVRDGVLVGEAFQHDSQTHSVTLMTMAENLLKTCCVEPGQLDAIACAAGPGSFTGVRIGVAAAKGFAWGAQKQLVGVSTLEAMVRSVAYADGIYIAAMDARRSQVYNAVFLQKNGILTRICEDRAISLEALGEELKYDKNVKFVVGDGAQLCYNTLSRTVEGIRLLPEHLQQQRASGVALAALSQLERGEVISAAELAPTYLRLSQAERERQAKLASRE